ncbi:hypothetical protein MUN89_00075 [Halobacillus salinarum]|uniref:Uncharacterized protein n=1 Tax=Halobacillus salinarum TaxID=2932257 RepID=A0ABY4EKP3_9BACI|nr:hypothetical protein [Halobacillus salinarum]UOQ44433.1 hypothetical protein MUN89_00075 [Halobacillus salinarum]
MKHSGRWISLAGVCILIVWKMIFYLTLIDTALGFAFLVLVPLLIEEAVQEPRSSRADRWLSQLMRLSLPFAVGGLSL